MPPLTEVRNTIRATSDDLIVKNKVFEAVQKFKVDFENSEGITKKINLVHYIFHQTNVCIKEGLEESKEYLEKYLNEKGLDPILKSDLQYAKALVAYYEGKYTEVIEIIHPKENSLFNTYQDDNAQLAQCHLLIGKAYWKLGHTLFSILHYFKAFSLLKKECIWKVKILELIARLKTEMLDILNDTIPNGMQWLNKAEKHLEKCVGKHYDYKTHYFFTSISNYKTLYNLEFTKSDGIAKLGLSKNSQESNIEILIDSFLKGVSDKLEINTKETLQEYQLNFYNNRSQAAFLKNRGLRKLSTGKHEHDTSEIESAIKDFQEDLKIRIELFPNKRHTTIGRNYIIQSEAYLEKYKLAQKSEDWKKSFWFVQQALELTINGFIVDGKNNPKEEILSEANFENNVISNYNLIHALRIKLDILTIEKVLDKELAINTVNLALRAIRIIRTKFKSELANLTFSSVAKKLYTSCLNILIKLEKTGALTTGLCDQKILNIFEESSYYSINQNFIEKEFDFYNSEETIEEISKNILGEKAFQLEKVIDKILIHNCFNVPVNSKVGADSVPDISKIQDYFVNKKRSSQIKLAFISFFLSNNKLFAFIIKEEGDAVIEELISGQNKILELKQQIEIFKTKINKQEKTTFAVAKKSSKWLNQVLFRPLQAHLNEINYLIIIPDGHLAQLPFEALITDSLDEERPIYLVEDYFVTYHHSISLLFKSIEENSSEQSTPSPKRLLFTGLGNLLNNDVSIENPKEWKIRTEIDKIISTLQENSIKDVVGYVDDASNHPNLKDFKDTIRIKTDIKDTQIVHLASHSSQNSYGEIKLSDNLYINARKDFHKLKLIVLNACRTSGRHIITGEGARGLGQAFLRENEIKNVIYTLSDIPDEAAFELMQYFYYYLSSPKRNHPVSFVVALCFAKRKFINEKRLMILASKSNEYHGLIPLICLSHVFVGNPLDGIE